MEPTSKKSFSETLAIPLAIVFGFALIAVAIYFSDIGAAPQVVANPVADTRLVPATEAIKKNIRTVDKTDYVRGFPNAPIVIVEYSDYDCPFCKNFHETMTRIMDEYGVNGKVAWVYRQFPIKQLHPNAPKISEAALCVGDLAGNDAFWKFSDQIFSLRGTNEPTSMTKLQEYAVTAGADKTQFLNCFESGKFKKAVEDSVAEAVAAGINGTPHSFVIIGNQQASIEGAQPYTAVKTIVDNLIGQLEGTVPKTDTN